MNSPGFIDMLLAAAFVGSLLFWIVFEFLSLRARLLRWLRQVTNPTPASAQEAAQRLTDPTAPREYAETRNTRQRGGW